jgi:hypothetical protein
MVYAFFVGLTLGLPLGCYMREAGYAHKIRSAYNVFVPPPETNKAEQYKSKAKDFYRNIRKGETEAKDFERYIYGGSHNLRSSDEADKVEKDVEKVMKEFRR